MQVRCAAHVLALVVKDAVLLYHKSIGRIRSVIKFVTGSPSRLAKFKECAALEKIDCKKMVFLDVKTRWNATYLMLDAAIPYEKVFKRLEREDRSFRDKYIFKESECEALPNTDADIVVIDNEEYYHSSSSESECEVDVSKKNNTKKKNKPHRHHAPYAEDWSYARCLVKCLKIFFDVTVRFSASFQ
ncbi:zinc finger BED domain-containing protein RICESLEEPER 2-like, partial [Papaver somniferum]|uniref:zinc finger BED domain-containing protein RICESLEEPER 2-like n=1 Tax=Papaver somniferum TaxID=3469 RepID=UPI000E6F5E0F